MSMIFANFSRAESAAAFAKQVSQNTGREALVFQSYDEADAHDPFPFEYRLPCVHVQRIWNDIDGGFTGESSIEAMVVDFSGEFVGT